MHPLPWNSPAEIRPNYFSLARCCSLALALSFARPRPLARAGIVGGLAAAMSAIEKLIAKPPPSPYDDERAQLDSGDGSDDPKHKDDDDATATTKDRAGAGDIELAIKNPVFSHPSAANNRERAATAVGAASHITQPAQRPTFQVPSSISAKMRMQQLQRPEDPRRGSVAVAGGAPNPFHRTFSNSIGGGSASQQQSMRRDESNASLAVAPGAHASTRAMVPPAIGGQSPRGNRRAI